MTNKEKEENSVLDHCNLLLDLGWEWDEVKALVGNSCWRVFIASMFGEENMKRMLGEEEYEEDE
jgi:hypothetical protein|tara:strand:+ start:1689 stop:1880 length:192 start_codon:yes stop_codon:yes gene_type:complete